MDAALQQFDPSAELEAWFERQVPRGGDEKTGADLAVIALAGLYDRLASDMNAFVDVFARGENGVGALTMGGLAYEYNFPYPDRGEPLWPMMNNAYGLLDEKAGRRCRRLKRKPLLPSGSGIESLTRDA